MKDEHKSKKTKQASQAKRPPKVFDVSRPGKAPASPTSRPWVAPSEAVADDQFVPGAPGLRASDPSAKHDLLDAKKKKDILPLSSSGETPAKEDTAGQASAPLLGDAPEVSEPEISQPLPTTPSAPAVSEAPQEPQEPAVAPADTAPEVPASADQAKVPAVTAAPEAAPSPTPAVEDEDDHEETPAHLALGQTVANHDNLPIWEHPDTSEQVEANHSATINSSPDKKSIEDLLAETDAPTLEPEKEPSMIISHHPRKQSKWWHSVLIFVVIITIAAVVFDVLIDMDIIRTTLSVPHTNFFN